MSEAISKEKLLECLNRAYQDTTSEKIAIAYHALVIAIDSGKFDIPDISELEHEIRLVRERNKRLEQEIEECAENNLCRKCANEGLQGAELLIKELEQERDKLIEGLRFYANEDNWRGGLSYLSDVHIDHGARAKRILTEIGVTI